MNLLYDHQIFALQKYGGISRYFYEIITRLARNNDLDVSLFMGFHINKYTLESHRNQYSKFFGVKRSVIPKTGKLFSAVNALLFGRFIRNMKVDIYHQTYYQKFIPPKKTKMVITVHDMIHEIYSHDFFSNDRTALYKRWSAAHSDGIICVSQSTKKDLVNILSIPEEKIRVIYHGNSMTGEVNSPPVLKTPYILYVGHRERYKNFDLLLNAYSQSRRINSEFNLVCFGGGPFKPEELEKIHKLGLTDRVMCYSGSDELLANFYKYATVFVYPSLYEGFGIPPLEAMHYGCPVIVSNTSSIPEVVGQAGLYFNPTSYEDLTFKLEKVLDDKELRDDLVKLGHEREKLFNWERCVKETKSFYRAVLER